MLMPNFFDLILEHKRKKTLRKIARQQYETSRGFAHLSILRSAKIVIDRRLGQFEKGLLSYQNDLKKLTLETNDELERALEKNIVLTRLQEVPGIGPQLSNRIVSNSFRGHIRDLKLASSSVPGIGGSKQYLINKWVENYIAQLPDLLQKPYAGKNEIVSEADRKRKEILDSIDRIRDKKSSLLIQQRTIKTWIVELEKVDEKDFLTAMISPEIVENDLVSFQKGIFADWEQIPDWFKDICVLASRENV
ncbi:MAG TPA: hypothetical protein VLR89_07185 [Anaerolineaceae bacterium]|nr:hypothetical protein [Anaerolineaceae bacterium]